MIFRFLNNKLGICICACSLIFYVLIKLPFNLSAFCTSDNEGFYLVYGQVFLLTKELIGGLLFTPLFSTIIQFTGFTTWAIITTHIFQTIVILIIGALIYLIVDQTTKDGFLAGLAVLFWILFILTPIGQSGLLHEIQGHLALEAEQLCILVQLCSILCLIQAGLLSREKMHYTTRNKLYSFIGSLLGVLSIGFKANGTLFALALIAFIALRPRASNPFAKSIISGIICGFICLNIIAITLTGFSDLVSFWKNYFLVGYYSYGQEVNLKFFFNKVLLFTTRNSNSLSNLFLFLCFLISVTYGIIKNKSPLWSMIGILGLANATGIVIPGKYESYYYHLIWPLVSISIVFGIHEIAKYCQQYKLKFQYSLVIIALLVFFIHRITVTIPAYKDIISALNKASVFNQPQSFQDPVLPYDDTQTDRPEFLQLADKINMLLPNKEDTFYIFNFSSKKFSGFSPTSYIYAKRYPSTAILDSTLAFNTVIERKLSKLKDDLKKRPPNLLIVSDEIFLQNWQLNSFDEFLQWFHSFIAQNYTLDSKLNYKFLNKSDEVFLVLKKQT